MTAVLVTAAPTSAQELEPRALINAPVGVNFLVVAAGYAHGNLLLDPGLPIEDGRARLGTLGLAYQKSVDMFGLAGKVGFVVPLATGSWEGTLAEKALKHCQRRGTMSQASPQPSWRCTECGFTLQAEQPPKICPMCRAQCEFHRHHLLPAGMRRARKY